jgi:NAD(P)-dependent dehydrogenase (short-subunit alcohol dehydrogenase family)
MEGNMRTFVITGANRGIGLGLTDYSLSQGNKVIACCRNPEGARDLWELESAYDGRLKIETLDVAHDEGIKALADKLGYETIDVLINNAGIMKSYSQSFGDLDLKSIEEMWRVNTLGPLKVTKALLPALLKSKSPIVANITSRMGSIADNTSGGSYGYRMSKAALNMFNKSFSIDYPQILSIVLHPGWVKTDLGGSSAPTEVMESAQGIYKIIVQAKKSDQGKFYDFRGSELPW